MSVLSDVADYLAANNVIEGTTGWAIELGFMSSTPDKLVSLIPSGSWQENIGDICFLSTDFFVRSDLNGFEEAESKMAEIISVIQNAQQGTIGSITNIKHEAGPIMLGRDANKRFLFRSVFFSVT